MTIDKDKLKQDIEAMRQKLTSMEEELNKPDVFKHFPSKGDEYYYYTHEGKIWISDTINDDLKINVFKTQAEAEKAYNKAVALEKIKRRLLELQGDWIPNFNDTFTKYIITYNYNYNKICFEVDAWKRINYLTLIPYIKTSEIAETIIDEMQDKLKIIFDIT